MTIIHLSEAPNLKVGPPTLHQPRTYTIVSFDPFHIFWSILTRGGEGEGQISYSRRVPKDDDVEKMECKIADLKVALSATNATLSCAMNTLKS